MMPHADPLFKVTIIPRGRALGGTQQLAEEERHTLPEDYLRDRLVVILSGRTAEKILLGTVSSGADDDIQQATTLARAMVSRWGMADNIGPIAPSRTRETASNQATQGSLAPSINVAKTQLRPMRENHRRK